jgi:hypothetical protein
MSLRAAQRRSNLNSWHGRLLCFAGNDIRGNATEDFAFTLHDAGQPC